MLWNVEGISQVGVPGKPRGYNNDQKRISCYTHIFNNGNKLQLLLEDLGSIIRLSNNFFL